MLMIGTGFWVIIIVHLLGCMSPGPDFLVVVKNTLSYNRKIAVYTVLGTSVGILMHTSYCALGLGVVLMAIPAFFKVIKVLGAGYLAYLSLKIFFSKTLLPTFQSQQNPVAMRPWQAFRVGFLTNALNPKAMLFILGLFIMVTKFDNPWWSLFFVIEMTVVTALWFLLLVYLLSQPLLKSKLLAAQGIINKCLAGLLMIFAVQLLVGGS